MVEGSDRTRPYSAPGALELDHVFEALAHPRRRYLLYAIDEATEWSLWEIAAKVTAWEQDVPIETLNDDEVERVYVSLYHNHVPKLVEDGIVEFVEANETIRPAANAEQVLVVLQNAGGSRDHEQEDHARSEQDEGFT